MQKQLVGTKSQLDAAKPELEAPCQESNSDVIAQRPIQEIHILSQGRLIPDEYRNIQANIAINSFKRICEQNPDNDFYSSQLAILENLDGDPINIIQAQSLNYVTRAMFETLYFFADYQARVYRNANGLEGNEESMQSNLTYAKLVEQFRFSNSALEGILGYLSRIGEGSLEAPYDNALYIYNHYDKQGNDLLNTYARLESFLKALNLYFDSDKEKFVSVGEPFVNFIKEEFALLEKEKKIDLSFDTQGVFDAWKHEIEDYKLLQKHFSGYNARTKSQLAELTAEMRNEQLLEFLQNLGTLRSKGSIFWGGAGTGKSRAAEKFAEMIGWRSTTVKVSELLSSYMHGSAENIGKKFEEIRSNAEKEQKKTIVIIDEADAIIGKLRAASNSAKDASEVRATLLTELQIDSPWVYYIFTTNFDPGDSELMDAAITRSGRMGKHVKFELPNLLSRKEIILGILEKPSVDIRELNIDLIAGVMEGFSPAQISEFLGDVAKKAFRKGDTKTRITTELFVKLFERKFKTTKEIK